MSVHAQSMRNGCATGRRRRSCNTGILPVPVRGWRDTCTDEDARVTRRSRPRGAGGDTPMRPIVLQILACALIAAGALRPGERLATAAGAAVVESVTVLPGERRVYNLSVEGDRRYLVTALRLLVHNAGACGGNLQTLSDNVITKNGISAHDLKEAYVGEGAMSQWNIALDKASGKLYLVPVRIGTTDPMPLDITLADAKVLYPR